MDLLGLASLTQCFSETHPSCDTTRCSSPSMAVYRSVVRTRRGLRDRPSTGKHLRCFPFVAIANDDAINI